MYTRKELSVGCLARLLIALRRFDTAVLRAVCVRFMDWLSEKSGFSVELLLTLSGVCFTLYFMRCVFGEAVSS